METAVLEGQYKSVPKSKWGKYQNAAKETIEKISRINIRIKTEDLDEIKRIADRKGIPYQTLINSVLHQFAKGDMIDINEVEQVERFKEKLTL